MEKVRELCPIVFQLTSISKILNDSYGVHDKIHECEFIPIVVTQPNGGGLWRSNIVYV